MSVTVIIPFYNAQKYIGEAIQSCLIQKEVSEIILVDDGSTDQSLSIAQEFAQKSTLISIKRHLTNKGRSAARNTGMRDVTSPYFSFLDADDFYLPYRFAAAIKTLNEDTQVDGIYEAVKTQSESPHQLIGIEEVTMLTEKVAPDQLFQHLVMGLGNFSIIGCTFRASIINDRLLFDEDFEIGEDTDWMWRVAYVCTLSGLHSDPKVIRTVNGDNTYADPQNAYKWKYKFYKKWNTRTSEYKMLPKMKTKLKKSLIYFALKHFSPFQS